MIALFCQQYFLRVYINQVWFLETGKCQRIRPVMHPYLVTLFLATGINIYRHGQGKGLSGLCLLQVNALLFCRFIPTISNVQYRMTAPIEPLIKKPVQVQAAGFFHRQAQLLRVSISQSMSSKIQMQALIKSGIAQVVAQHIEDTPAFLIGYAVKHFLFVRIVKTDEAFLPLLRVTQVTLLAQV